MKLTGVIYKITNIINNKVYIGQTVNTIKYRWHKHCNSDGCRSLHNAILKYGKENFNIEIIETLPIEKLDEREIYWISFYKSNTKKFGYNILLGGNLGRKGFSKLSKEQINEIIELDKQGITHIEIGKKFNINRKTVTFILRRESNYTTKITRYKDRHAYAHAHAHDQAHDLHKRCTIYAHDQLQHDQALYGSSTC